MKTIIGILALLSIIFLVGCSAKDTNKISKKELQEIAGKYGGVYIFDKKYLKEIEERESKREAINQQILNEILSIENKNERNKQMRKLLKERYYDNPNIAQLLSNGKKYYTTTREYGNDYKKQAKIPKIYFDKIVNFIGKENYKKYKPNISLGYFYIDNDKVIPIYLSATYSYKQTNYGIFGDEGSGIHFSNKEIKYILGGNKFYLNQTTNAFERLDNE